MFRALFTTLLAGTLVGCGQSPRTQVNLTGTLTTNQFEMHPGDCCVFRLPSGNTVAVWCVRPRSFWGGAEKTDSKSGLETVWGEVPFRRPKEILAKAGSNNHYAVVGWKSYIAPSMISIMGDTARQYGFSVDGHYLLITEDLRATNCLPVTILAGKE
jgi:hypothetical protein